MERGLLTKYIENDVNTISVVKELPRKLYIIFCFFTIWSLLFSSFVVYLTKRGYKLPAFLWRSAFSLTMACSVSGTFIAYTHTKAFTDKFKVNKFLIYITDVITHVIPLIIILKLKNWMKLNSLPTTKNTLLKMLSLNGLIGGIYLYLFGTSLYPVSHKFILSGIPFPIILSTLYFSRV
tara:strand:- start:651 stop:1187 length:537 start_codon:yes stop_codon:yes gene_type:complete